MHIITNETSISCEKCKQHRAREHGPWTRDHRPRPELVEARGASASIAAIIGCALCLFTSLSLSLALPHSLAVSFSLCVCLHVTCFLAHSLWPFASTPRCGQFLVGVALGSTRSFRFCTISLWIFMHVPQAIYICVYLYIRSGCVFVCFYRTAKKIFNKRANCKAKLKAMKCLMKSNSQRVVKRNSFRINAIFIYKSIYS